MLRKSLFLVLLNLSLASPIQAQHPLVLQKLNEWNDAAPAPSGEKFEEEIRNTAKEIYGPGDACANSAIIIERVHPATADRFVFNALIRQQMRNAWTLIARLPGCDADPARYMVMQNIDNSLKTIRINRGISYAPDSLIGDALPSASLAAAAALKRAGGSCEIGEKSKLGVIRIESEEDGLGADLFGVRYVGGWNEIWPIEICGRIVEVLVEFTADGDGGAYYKVPGDQITILPK